MTDRPIIFSGAMVRAILREIREPGTGKTQTRRVITNTAAIDALAVFGPKFLLLPGNIDLVHYEIGDRLWVRENWQSGFTGDGPQISYAAEPDYCQIDAWDGPDEGAGPSFNYDRCPGASFSLWLSDVIAANGPWRPSIHMPRWASRLTLPIIDVRVERLQYISKGDAIAEGIVRLESGQWADYPLGSSAAGWEDPRESFRTLWDSINGKPRARKGKEPLDLSWAANPWVVAVTFSPEMRNIDAAKAT